MRALILAAGYGTRLYPYVKNFPKPLLKVNNKPIIEYLLEKLYKLDKLSSIIVVTNDRFFKYFQDWKEGLENKKKIRIINDLSRSPKDKLGAIKDMYLAFDKAGLDDDYLVLGGDNFFQQPLKGFISFAKKKHPATSIGLFDLKDKLEASHYGVVKINSRKKITEFVEKPPAPESSLVATCVYYFPQEKLKLTKACLDSSETCFDNIGAYIRWLTENDEVYGYTFKDLWVDIGRIETYNKLNRTLKGER